MSVCVCALNCGGIPSPEPHHNWRFGASLICIFVCILWSLSWQFFWDFCWYAFKRWGHRIVRPSLLFVEEPLYWNLTKNWSSGQILWFFFTICHGNELVHLHWNLHVKIWNVVFGTICHGWLTTFFQPFLWHWMWSSLYCPSHGTLHRILHNYGWWNYVKWVSGILEQIFVSALKCSESVALGASALPPNNLRTKFWLLWIPCAHLLEWWPHLAFSRSELARLRSLKYIRFTISVHCIFVNLKPKSLIGC